MNGSYACSVCGVLTSDWYFIEGRYWCDDHAAEGRKLRGRLKSKRQPYPNE